MYYRVSTFQIVPACSFQLKMRFNTFLAHVVRNIFSEHTVCPSTHPCCCIRQPDTHSWQTSMCALYKSEDFCRESQVAGKLTRFGNLSRSIGTVHSLEISRVQKAVHSFTVARFGLSHRQGRHSEKNPSLCDRISLFGFLKCGLVLVSTVTDIASLSMAPVSFTVFFNNQLFCRFSRDLLQTTTSSLAVQSQTFLSHPESLNVS